VVERSIDKVSIELAKACDLSACISSKLNETSFNTSVRKRVVAPCFAVALDHFDAVLVLLGRNPKIYSSSFALMRLVFESYIRGLWLLYCATDEEIESFSSGTFELPRKIEVMINSIENVCDFDGKQLSITRSKYWKQLCDYTHTGILQVQRWNKYDSIEPSYSDDEVIEVILFTKSYALLAAVSFAEAVLNNSELANELLTMASEMLTQ